MSACEDRFFTDKDIFSPKIEKETTEQTVISKTDSQKNNKETFENSRKIHAKTKLENLKHSVIIIGYK